MAAIYFNNAVDTDVSNNLNWWDDAGFTVPAGRVASTGDDAYFTADAASGSVTANPDRVFISGPFAITIVAVIAATITSGGVFITGASLNAPTITINGTAVVSGGALGGTVAISDAVDNGAEISGSLTLSGTASNGASVSGNVINAGSGNNSGTIGGNYTLTSNGTNVGGTVVGMLTVPGTQAGNAITSNLSFSNLGTFGTLKLSGIVAGAPPITRLGKSALIG